MSEYPVSEKLATLRDEMVAVRDFLEWASGEKNTHLLTFAGDDIGYVPVHTDSLLCEHMGIDPVALEQERRDMLAKAREVN